MTTDIEFIETEFKYKKMKKNLKRATYVANVSHKKLKKSDLFEEEFSNLLENQSELNILDIFQVKKSLNNHKILSIKAIKGIKKCHLYEILLDQRLPKWMQEEKIVGLQLESSRKYEPVGKKTIDLLQKNYDFIIYLKVHSLYSSNFDFGLNLPNLKHFFCDDHEYRFGYSPGPGTYFQTLSLNFDINVIPQFEKEQIENLTCIFVQNYNLFYYLVRQMKNLKVLTISHSKFALTPQFHNETSNPYLPSYQTVDLLPKTLAHMTLEHCNVDFDDLFKLMLHLDKNPEFESLTLNSICIENWHSTIYDKYSRRLKYIIKSDTNQLLPKEINFFQVDSSLKNGRIDLYKKKMMPYLYCLGLKKPFLHLTSLLIELIYDYWKCGINDIYTTGDYYKITE